VSGQGHYVGTYLAIGVHNNDWWGEGEIMDPIRFKQIFRVTIQDLGYRAPQGGRGRYFHRQDDINSTAFWYQVEPHADFPHQPGLDELEVF
jgi:hypothetical protein